MIMTYAHESLSAKRAKVVEDHNRALRRLDALEGAHTVALAMMADWRAAKRGREARIYVGEICLMITLDLATGEIFGDAVEAFAAAELVIRATFPANWEGKWSDVEDSSRADVAQRQTILHVHPPGGAWYSNGVSVWLTVSARITAESACQVVQIGERVETFSVPSQRTVPVFKSVCPGDPAPMAAE